MSIARLMQMAASGQGGEPDPFFNQTTLLLHGDGTNGAQNNTFLDSSTNNFTITRNGNTTQGTFSPFSLPNGEWSNFGGSGSQSIQIADNAAFDLPNDFTIEFWVYPTNITNSYFVSIGDIRAGNDGLQIYTGGAVLSFYSNGSVILTGPSLSNNQWYHIAVVRSGGGSNNLKMYVNGVQEAQATNTTSFTGVASNGFSVAREYSGSYFYGWQHYISNVRLVKGTAVYTGAFTPSTAPLTAISGTEVLICQSNRFVDNSTNNFAITVTGTPSVQPFSPFLPTAEYDASVNGGSGYFDGSGDYLTTPSSADFEFTGDHTVEAWVYLLAATEDQTVYGTGGAGQADQFTIISTGELYWANQGTSAGVITINQWLHIAASRSGTSLKIFVNGVEKKSATVSGTIGQNASAYVGRRSDGNNPVNGYISSLRIIKGTALYTSDFTPPTAPLTDITNTELLLNFTNAGIFDNTGKNNLETVGNAQIDTTTKKYGTGSMEFDGTGDYLFQPNGVNQNFAFGTGNFTIECWLYLNTVSGDQVITDFRAVNDARTTAFSFSTTGTALKVYINGDRSLGGTLAINTWYHIALVRNGTGSNNLTAYINGTATGTTATLTENLTDTSIQIGAVAGGGVAQLNGFIDDLRITKGVARYTANFTPPTAAFPNL